MSTVFVQFSDETETVIIGQFFGMGQPEELFPHQGEVEETDERYVAFKKILDGVGYAGV